MRPKQIPTTASSACGARSRKRKKTASVSGAASASGKRRLNLFRLFLRFCQEQYQLTKLVEKIPMSQAKRRKAASLKWSQQTAAKLLKLKNRLGGVDKRASAL